MRLSESDLNQIRVLLGRDPSVVESYVFDAMWSEHCSYKSSKRVLKAHLPTQSAVVALGIGEDSGIFRWTHHEGKSYCIAISHESHNHPSQILPIEGAATGVGGVVRDVYCMGADVIGVLNSLHFGIPEGPDSHVEEIATNVVVGVSDYANPLGVPVLGGETVFHPSYNDNCLVNVAAVGLLTEDRIIRSRVPERAAREPYDVILVGKSTDATGFGGASFSSATLDEEDTSANMGAVQVHDPFLKRVVVEAIRQLLKEVETTGVEIGFKDLGAGGIACATSEIAAAGGFGVTVDLDAVNVAIRDLPSEVIAVSETQERFCLVVPRNFKDRVLQIFNDDFALPQLYPHAGAVVIGTVKTEQTFTLLRAGHVVCDLPVKAITTEVSAHRESISRPINRTAADPAPVQSEVVAQACQEIVAHLNGESKYYVYRHFDQAVRGETVCYPGEVDAVVTAPVRGLFTGLAVSMDSNIYGNHDPYVSGAYAVAESIRNVVAVGGVPLALTDCLNYGNPEKPDVFFDFEEGVKGIADAARKLNPFGEEPIAIISGNVSFYNESKKGRAVVPSPVVACCGRVDDFRRIPGIPLKAADSVLIRIGGYYPEFGGTALSDILRGLNTVAPQVRFELECLANHVVWNLIAERMVLACHDISQGGLWLAVVEMALGARATGTIGVQLQLPEGVHPFSWLFSENGGFVIEVSADKIGDVRRRLTTANVPWDEVGMTQSHPTLNVTQQGNLIVNWPLADVAVVWKRRA